MGISRLIAGVFALLLFSSGATAHVVDASSVRIDVFADTLRISQTTPLHTAILASGGAIEKASSHQNIAQKLAELWQVSSAGKQCNVRKTQHALSHNDTQFEFQLELACDVKGEVKIAFDWLANATNAHHASVALSIAKKRKLAVVPQSQPVMIIPVDTLLKEWGVSLEPASVRSLSKKHSNHHN